MRATLKANLSRNAKKGLETSGGKNRRMMSVTVKDKAVYRDGSDMVAVNSTAASYAQ